MATSSRFLFMILMVLAAAPVLFALLFNFSPVINFVLVMFALVCDLLAFSTKYYAEFFTPFLHARGGIVTLNDSEAFTVAPSGNAIIVRNGQNIYASAFVKIPSYRSATEMTEEEKSNFSRSFSRVLTLSKEPVRFTAQLYVIDKDTYIENIKSKLNEAEEKYQNMTIDKSVSKADSERVRGEVTMWHNLFDNINKTRSHSLEAFAMVTAPGGNEEEAINMALQQADEIVAGASSTLGISANVVEGQELLKFLEPDYMIPAVTISEQMRERTVSKEI
ncbi:Uncharacterised protein [uncultured archaeon]|nr:Uncharacterised protein [uncultured archaeon]